MTWSVYIFAISFGIEALALVTWPLERRGNLDICDVQGQASAIVGGQLWMTGGTYSFDGGDTNAFEANMYSIPLASPFPAHAFLSANLYKTIPLPSGVPYQAAASNAQMFYDNTTLSLFYANLSASSRGFPSYNTFTSSWSNDVSVDGYDANTNTILSQFPSGGYTQGVSVPSTGYSYYAGTTTFLAQSYKLSRRDEGSMAWLYQMQAANGQLQSNLTTGGPLLDNAVMVYIRAGSQGVLVAFGGTNPQSHTDFSGTLNDYRDLSRIFVYDIASSRWFNVTTTGDTPPNRREFCAGVSTAPDSSSFQVTIYGGYDLQGAIGPLNDVWVLSIPTFQWINVTPSDQSLGDGSGFGRHFHKCHMGSEAQMIILGGTIQTTSNPTQIVSGTGCDEAHAPLLVLNTNTFEWSDTFTPGLNYTVPVPVFQAIGGDPTGNAPSAPSGGFDDPALGPIFSRHVPFTPMPTPEVTAGGASRTGSSGDGSSATSGKNNISTGAIAGAVIGGVLAIIIISGLVFWLISKRRTTSTYHQARSGSPSAGSNTTKTGSHVAVLEKQELDSRQQYELDSRQQPRGQQYNRAELPGRSTVYEMDGTDVRYG